MSCLCGVWSIRRHDKCRDTLGRCFDSYGEGPASTEQVVLAACSHGEPRLDLVVVGPTGHRARLDVAVTDCLTAAAMRSPAAAKRPGVAASIMEAHKRASHPGVRITPAVVETHGRLGNTLLAFVRSAYAGLEDMERALAVRDTYRSLAATLQHQNAEAVLRASPASVAQPSQPAETVT